MKARLLKDIRDPTGETDEVIPAGTMVEVVDMTADCNGTCFRGSVARPGSITEYIRQRGLLPSEEIDRLVAQVPTHIVAYQEAFAQGEEIPSWEQFFCSLDDDSHSEPERLSLPVLF